MNRCRREGVGAGTGLGARGSLGDEQTTITTNRHYLPPI